MNRGHYITTCFGLEKAEDKELAGTTARLMNSYMAWAHEKLSAHPINAKRAKRASPP